MTLRTVLLAIPLATPVALPAQTETPEAVAEQYFRAMRSENAAAVAKLMHPDALAELRDLLDPLFQSTLPEADDFRQRFLGVRTVTEAQALSDTTVFLNFLGSLADQLPVFGAALRGASMETLGHVTEGADTAHVVYRVTVEIEDLTVRRITVLSLRRHGETWRGLLTGDYSELAAVLRATLGG
jgi:hypothetical protein